MQASRQPTHSVDAPAQSIEHDGVPDALGPAPLPADHLLHLVREPAHQVSNHNDSRHINHHQQQQEQLSQDLVLLSSLDSARNSFLTALSSLLNTSLRSEPNTLPVAPHFTPAAFYEDISSPIAALRRHSLPFTQHLSSSPPSSSSSSVSTTTPIIRDTSSLAPFTIAHVDPLLNLLRSSLNTTYPEESMRSLGLSPFFHPSPLDQLSTLINRACEENRFATRQDEHLAVSLAALVSSADRLVTIDRDYIDQLHRNSSGPSSSSLDTLRQTEKRVIWARLLKLLDNLGDLSNSRSSHLPSENPTLSYTFPSVSNPSPVVDKTENVEGAALNDNASWTQPPTEEEPPNYSDLPPEYAQYATEDNSSHAYDNKIQGDQKQNDYFSPSISNKLHPDKNINEKLAHDLEALTLSIERLHQLNPQMLNQRADIKNPLASPINVNRNLRPVASTSNTSEQFSKEKNLAALAETVERMQRGRMNDQRTSCTFTPPKAISSVVRSRSSTSNHYEQHHDEEKFWSAIEKAQARRLSNQRVAFNAYKQYSAKLKDNANSLNALNSVDEEKSSAILSADELELARQEHIISAIGKGRLTFQDANLPESITSPLKDINDFLRSSNDDDTEDDSVNRGNNSSSRFNPHYVPATRRTRSLPFAVPPSPSSYEPMGRSASNDAVVDQQQQPSSQSSATPAKSIGRFFGKLKKPSSNSISYHRSTSMSSLQQAYSSKEAATIQFSDEDDSAIPATESLNFLPSSISANNTSSNVSKEINSNSTISKLPADLEFEFFTEERKNLASINVIVWIKSLASTKVDGQDNNNTYDDLSYLHGWTAKGPAPDDLCSLVLYHAASHTELIVPLPSPLAPFASPITLIPKWSPANETLNDEESSQQGAAYLEVVVKVLGSQSGARSRHDLEVVYPYTASQLNKFKPRSYLCASCKVELISDTSGVIKSYIELPSEHWAELFEAWMCHQPEISLPENGTAANGSANGSRKHSSSISSSKSNSAKSEKSTKIYSPHSHQHHHANGNNFLSIIENERPRWPRDDSEVMEAETSLSFSTNVVGNWALKSGHNKQRGSMKQGDLVDGEWEPVVCYACEFPLGHYGRRQRRRKSPAATKDQPDNEEDEGVEECLRLNKYSLQPAGSCNVQADGVAGKPIEKCPLVMHLSAQLLDLSQARAVHRFAIIDEESCTPQCWLWLFNPSVAIVSSSPITMNDMIIEAGARFDAVKVFYRVASPPSGGGVGFLNKVRSRGYSSASSSSQNEKDGNSNSDDYSSNITQHNSHPNHHYPPHLNQQQHQSLISSCDNIFGAGQDAELVFWPYRVCTRFSASLQASKTVLPKFNNTMGVFHAGLLPRLQAPHP